MGKFAISVEQVSKKYQIGQREPYRTLRDTLTEAFTAPFRRLGQQSDPNGQESNPTIWALKDVSFEVQHGEVVGIIGRNGAGKSTLLKILSRITEPTAGRVRLKGRVGSLLEVGTGFNGELTGRDNIFLNGAILGMKRREIERKFDEIVAFAEIETFMDTPVKRYSSGMYMRLAFSVAAHLEPEILIVDEVLAVGDTRFQKKCLEKMSEVGAGGRTVLFVSHNMSAINRLCSRAILLVEGLVKLDDHAHQVVSYYLQSDAGTSAIRIWPNLEESPGDEVVRLRSTSVRNDSNEVSDTIDIRSTLAIEINYEVLKSGAVLTPSIRVFNDEGIVVFTSIDTEYTWHSTARTTGPYVSKVFVPGNFLSEGRYVVTVMIGTQSPLTKHVYERDSVAFVIVDSTEGGSARGGYGGALTGVVRPLLEWSTNRTRI